MRRLLCTIALLFGLSPLTALAAAEPDLFDPGSLVQAADPAVADPVAAAVPAAPAEDTAVERAKAMENTIGRSILNLYLQEKGIASQTMDVGLVHVQLINGAVLANGAKALAQANQALEGLETWTGRPGVFSRKDLPAPEQYWIALFADGPSFDNFIDWMRAKGVLAPVDPNQQDLTKLTKSFGIARFHVGVQDSCNNSPVNYCVYSTTCEAIDAFYGTRGNPAPAWLREGLHAELQRLLCDGKITWMTISYQMNTPGIVSDNWAQDIKNFITATDPKMKGKLLRANMVTDLDVIALDPAQYRQMWSLCNMVRAKAGNVKGEKNQFYQLLTATAGGERSYKAVEKIMGFKDPAWSNLWVQWAMQQK